MSLYKCSTQLLYFTLRLLISDEKKRINYSFLIEKKFTRSKREMSEGKILYNCTSLFILCKIFDDCRTFQKVVIKI